MRKANNIDPLDEIMEDLMVGHNFEYARAAIQLLMVQERLVLLRGLPLYDYPTSRAVPERIIADLIAEYSELQSQLKPIHGSETI